jgi:hypothetical protein
MAKRNTTSEETERKLRRRIAKRKYERKKRKLTCSPFETRAEIGTCSARVKRLKKVWIKDVASFSCPRCENNLKEDLIRLRQDCFECRKCGNVFIKENVVDEFDFDGL